MMKGWKGAAVILALFLVSGTYASAFELQSRGVITLERSPDSIAVMQYGDILFAVDKEVKALSLLDLKQSSVVRTIPLSISPISVAYDTMRQRVAGADGNGSILMIDPVTVASAHTLKTGRSLLHLTIHEKSGIVYVSDDSGVLMLDPETGSLINSFDLAGISGFAIDHRLNLLVAVAGQQIGLFDAETLDPLAALEADLPLSGVGINPSTHIAIITSATGGKVFAVSLETRTFVGSLSLSGAPSAVTVDSAKNLAYIVCSNGISAVQLENPQPKIGEIMPNTARAGDDKFLLSVEGERFLRSSSTLFDNTDMATGFVSTETLTAEIPARSLLRPGNIPVNVTNPQPGGGTSNTLYFKIYNPAPVLELIEPEAVALNTDFTLRVRGRNFFNGSSINLNGENLRTRFISSILLEASVPSSQIQSIGSYPVVVINPNSGSFTSNAGMITVMSQAQSEDWTAKDNSGVSSETGDLRGKIVNTQLQPLEGITIKVRNRTTVTAANGSFLLTEVPAGKRTVLIDGSTEKRGGGHYPTIPLTIDIAPDKVNDMPFQVYLHQQKNRNFMHIDHDTLGSRDTDTQTPLFGPDGALIVTDSEVQGLELKIPKGLKIRGWDNHKNQKISARTVPPDRLPIKPLPKEANARTVHMFYFNKVGGGTPDQPVPFKAKNDLNLLPGEKAMLWYYDESPNEGEAPNDWAVAGTGTVTPDGKYIVSDPGVGIPKFCCGAATWSGSGSNKEPNGSSAGDGPTTCNLYGDPVDITTGYFVHEHTDLVVPGLMPINITRYYRGKDSGNIENLGAFGLNTYFEYDWWMGTYANMQLLVMPGNLQYRYQLQPNGTYTNDSDPGARGDVVTISGNTKVLKRRSGSVYTFNSSGQLTAISDRNGNAITLTRRSAYEGNYLTRITNQEGRYVTFNQTYTGNFFRTDSLVDDTGRTVVYSYDTYGGYPRLLKATYPDGSAMMYEYDTAGRMTGIINKKGIREVLNEYNAENRIIKQTHADGGVYAFSYYTAGGSIIETTMTEPNGAVTTWGFYDYATRSNFFDKYITYKTTPDGTTVYDRQVNTNEVNSATDFLGRTTSYTYWPEGQVKTVTDNLGNVTAYEYEPLYGMLTKITDALGKITTIAYTFDSGSKITKAEITDPLLNKTTVNYNAVGLPSSITDPLNHTTSLFYENSTRPAQLTKVTDPLGNSMTISYDNLGRQKSRTDAKGKTTFLGYDFTDRVIGVMDPLYNVTRFSYDNSGNMLSFTDAKNHLISYTYDQRDRLKTMTDQFGRLEAYNYDTSDRLTSVTDRKAQSTTFTTYDSMNRIKRITYHDGSTTDYAYDAGGRITTITDSASGLISYTYEGASCGSGCTSFPDRVTREVTPLGIIDYTYDKLGRRSTMRVAGQQPVYYTYDAAGRLTKISQLVNGVSRDFNIVYDAGGRRKSMSVLLTGKGKNIPSLITNYSYDNADRVLNIQHLKATTVIENLLYEYDPNGNRTKFTRNSTQAKPGSVTSSNYNDANEMLNFTPAAGSAKNMTYDNNGNMTSVTTACGTTTYTWNARNQLVGIQGFNALCAPLSAVFKYDALGRRYEKTINGTTTQYVYDGLDVIQEKNQSGAVTANYIRTLNIDEPLARIKADGTVRHYKADVLGSIIALIDDTGAVKTTYVYDPFGNVTVSGESMDNPFQFAGRENDGIGLLFERNRYYSPELMRYISQDPIGLAGGDVNYYVRVGNNPVNYVDPLGLFSAGYRFGYKYPGHADFPGGNYFDYNREDTDPKTNPITGDPERHFRDLPVSEGDVAKATESCDKDAFQRAMHRGQDYFSHYGKGYRWNPGRGRGLGFGHLFPLVGTSPDSDRDAWNAAAQWSQGKLDKWNKKCGCK